MPLPIPCTRHPLPPAPAPRGSRACPAVNQPPRLPQNPPPPANPAPRLRNNRRETPVRRALANPTPAANATDTCTHARDSPQSTTRRAAGWRRRRRRPQACVRHGGGELPAGAEAVRGGGRATPGVPGAGGVLRPAVGLDAAAARGLLQLLGAGAVPEAAGVRPGGAEPAQDQQMGADLRLRSREPRGLHARPRQRTPQYMRMSCSSGSPSTPRSLCPCTPALPVAPPIPVSPSSASRRTSPAPVPSPATRGPKIDLFFRQWEERGRRGGLDFLCREGSLGVGIPGVALLRPLLTTDTLERQSCGIRTWRWTRGGASAGIASLRGTGATCALREKEAELEAARARLHVVELEEWL
jgi:hypothetical protein